MNKKKKQETPGTKTENIIAVMTSGIKKGDLVQQSFGWAEAEEDSYKDENEVFCVKLSTRLVKFMSKDQPIQVKRKK